MRTFRAAVYARLSREDTEKAVSDSITNQIALIRDFAASQPDIDVRSERVDDGYSGSNFDRPAFAAMLGDIKSGVINCVIVKDFSRFGRNYIEVGKYIDQIFPFLGVRFISVNDRYDSLRGKSESDELIIPFKNLINDAYIRDLSVKIRSQLAVKRKKGEFVGAFAVYGYLKSAGNKNELVVDEYAGKVVQDIFKWKLEGLGNQKIADRLQAGGELSPLEHKRFLGQNLTTSFQRSEQASWSAAAVARILRNPVYTGVLQQGKVTTPNHKVKKRVALPESEWITVHGAHPPLIDRRDFEIVAGLLGSAARAAPRRETAYPFSGLLFCKGCGGAMSRKTVTRGGRKYVYYVCATNKAGKGCSAHSFSVPRLDDAVLAVLGRQIAGFADLTELGGCLDALQTGLSEARKLAERIALREAEAEKYRNLRQSAYEDYRDAFLSEAEYRDFSRLYAQKARTAEAGADELRKALDRLAGESAPPAWAEDFKARQTIGPLTRKLAACLIARVEFHGDNRIELQFPYRDPLAELQATSIGV